mmetsp:Transcript_23421/g.17865  ORF Transcript_23421/g.17865 Transcript_23421/m.17865 type:complete len:155 (+) Transcript_23421:441-905(+)
MDTVGKLQLQKVELKDLMDKVHLVKLDTEIRNMEVAASFTTWTLKEVINEIEDIVEGEKSVRHAHIQKKIEGFLEKEVHLRQFLKKEPNANQAFLEYLLPVLVQSGANINVSKFNIESDQNKLNSETIYVNVCGKYKDMNAMASRTLIVNPSEA